MFLKKTSYHRWMEEEVASKRNRISLPNNPTIEITIARRVSARKDAKIVSGGALFGRYYASHNEWTRKRDEWMIILSGR
jgi:hypothetical protein